MTTEWEDLLEESCFDGNIEIATVVTQRARVPGGWLYRFQTTHFRIIDDYIGGWRVPGSGRPAGVERIDYTEPSFVPDATP